MNPKIEIALALIHREGRILVAQRAREPLEDYWEFPGGKIEPGESVESAAFRESLEELDVEVETGDRLDSVVHEYPDVTVNLHPVLCRLMEGAQPRPLASKALAWADPRELATWNIPEPNFAILEQLRRTKL